MDIVFYSPQTLPSIGGLQYVVHYWAEALTERGHRVTVITETPGADSEALSEAQGQYRVLRNAGFRQQVKAMRGAEKVVMFNVSLKGLPALLLSGRPLWVTHHTALWYDKGPKPLRQRFKQWVANHIATANCACSGYIASLYHNCRVIYSPYRADVFVQGQLPRRPASLFFAGRLVSDKGVDLLLHACAQLKREGVFFSLTLAGDGPDREALRRLAGELGLNLPDTGAGERTASTDGVWMGALDQPRLVHLMQTHEIMVVPSRMEPMGMVVAEGLACGCRMVVSHQGGMPEVGGSFCRYFETGNVQSLATAIRDQLTNPLPVSAILLQNHLEKFTIDYSVWELEKWLSGV